MLSVLDLNPQLNFGFECLAYTPSLTFELILETTYHFYHVFTYLDY